MNHFESLRCISEAQKIKRYLKLDFPTEYTSRCFRVVVATILDNHKDHVLDVKNINSLVIIIHDQVMIY